MDDTPFKEQFRQIPPPMVEEVRNHLREMLESGAIRPSQSAWYNVVMLVRKKDSGLHFCINFQCLNAHMKKDAYPLPRIQEVLESLLGTGHFSCLDLKSRFWQKRWTRHQSSTLPSLWVIWDSLSVIECLLDSVMHQLCSNGLCRIVWVS